MPTEAGPLSEEERGEVPPVNRPVRIVEEGGGRSRVVPTESPNRQARKIMRFLLREVAAVRGHAHQLTQHRPELIEVPSLEHWVNRLDPCDERLADLIRHASTIASLRFPSLVGSRQTHETRRPTGGG